MKTIEVIGYKRSRMGKSEAKKLRKKGMVPCVVYGNEKNIHFHSPMILFKKLIYTDEAHFVNLTIEGEPETFEAILQEVQFHPVNETILHVDFLRLTRGVPIKMNIPIHTKGTSVGMLSGGKLIKKVKYLKIKALPKNMPEFVEVDVSNLSLGMSVKVRELSKGDYEIINNPSVTLAGIEIPRVLRGKESELEEEVEQAETTEETNK